MSRSRILILTQPADVHALAVAEGLRRKGIEAVVWLTPDFPLRAEETLRLGRAGVSLTARGPGLDLAAGDIATVWNRRPAIGLDRELLHPADLPLAERSCELLRRSFLALLAPEALWINPPRAVEQHTKPIQLKLAQEVGWTIPETLVTNDPAEIRAFIAEQGGRAVFKPLTTSFWKSGHRFLAPYTRIISAADLVADELLRSAPGILQEPVRKAWEARLTVIGEQVFGARLASQQTERGRTDWRRAYGELEIEPLEVPAEVAARCRSFLDAAGLVFGCIDAAVTPVGEWVFLENNQGGQFLFVEQATGLPLLDAFCELLRQRRADFDWREDRVAVRFAEVEHLALRRSRELVQTHNPAPGYAWEEAPG